MTGRSRPKDRPRTTNGRKGQGREKQVRSGKERNQLQKRIARRKKTELEVKVSERKRNEEKRRRVADMDMGRVVKRRSRRRNGSDLDPGRDRLLGESRI